MRTAAYKVDVASDRRDNSRNSQSVFLVVGEHLKKLQYHAPAKIPSQSSKGAGLC